MRPRAIRCLVAPLTVLALAACGDDPAPSAHNAGSAADGGGGSLLDGGAGRPDPEPSADARGDRSAGQATTRATRPVVLDHQEQPFQGASYDTGWQPSGSPVQVRFVATLKAQAETRLAGKATLTRGKLLTLTHAGDPAGGRFKMDIGFDTSCKLRIDTSLVKWEGSLPLVPQFDLRFQGEKTFTPFALAGSANRPVHLEDVIQKKSLFSVPIPGLGISIPLVGKVGGVVNVKASGLLKADLVGRELATTLQGGPTLRHTQEGQTVTSPDRGKSTETTTVTGQTDVTFSGAIVLYPTITVTAPIGGLSWDVAEFPLTIDLSTFGKLSNTWQLSSQSAVFVLQ